MGKKLKAFALTVVIIFGVFALSVFGCAFLLTKKEAPKKGIARIESMIGVSLPSGAEVEYHHYDASMDGSFTQYTVLKFQEYPVEFLNRYQFVKWLDTSGKEEFLRELKTRRIPNDHIPNIDETWRSAIVGSYKGQGLKAIYLPKTMKLIFSITYVS